MLNIYKYYDEPSVLPLYKELSYKMRLLDNSAEWMPSDAKKLEPLLHIIAQNAKFAFYYAYNILKGRFKEAEANIMKNPIYAYQYAREILAEDKEWTSQPGHENGRWPEAEPYIMTEPPQAYFYARYIIKGRWPDAEPSIKRVNTFWNSYREMFGVQ